MRLSYTRTQRNENRRRDIQPAKHQPGKGRKIVDSREMIVPPSVCLRVLCGGDFCFSFVLLRSLRG